MKVLLVLAVFSVQAIWNCEAYCETIEKQELLGECLGEHLPEEFSTKLLECLSKATGSQIQLREIFLIACGPEPRHFRKCIDEQRDYINENRVALREAEDLTDQCVVDRLGYNQGVDDDETYEKRSATYKRSANALWYKKRSADATYKKRSADATYKKRSADAAYKKRSADAATYKRSANALWYKKRSADVTYKKRSADPAYKKRSADATYKKRSADALWYKKRSADAAYKKRSADAAYKKRSADALWF